MFLEVQQSSLDDVLLIESQNKATFLGFLETIVRHVIIPPFFIESSKKHFEAKVDYLSMISKEKPSNENCRFKLNIDSIAEEFLASLRNVIL